MSNQLNERPISEGRNVNLRHFPRVVSDFEAMGWLPFLSVFGSIFPPLVYEFYTNFEFIAGNRVTFRMSGNLYSYGVAEFGELFGITAVGNNYPPQIRPDQLWQFLCRVAIPYRLTQRTGILREYLRPEIDVHYEIIRSNIYHRDEHEDVLSATEQVLLWCMGHQVRINNAQLVAARMSQVRYGPEFCLPYGHFLSRLFSRIGVLQGPIPSRPISTVRIDRDTFPDDISIMPEPLANETSDVPETRRIPSNSSSGGSSTRSDARSYARR